MAKTESYKLWRDDEVAYLRETYDEATAELIAKTLDRTLDSIWTKAEREGLRKRKKSQERNKEGPWLCPSCDKTKPTEEFGKRGDTGTTNCKACINKNQRERRKQ